MERRAAERRRHRKTCRTALGTLNSMRGARRAAADNRSPHENPSGVAEKLSFAASSYTAHLRRMSLSTNPAQAL